MGRTLVALAFVVSSAITSQGEITVSDFGNIRLFTMTNANGMEIKVTNYGATITAINVPDRAGKLADVTLGYNDVAGYINAVEKPYFGAIVGRYGNRIAKGKFELDGQEYSLPINNAPNSLHGGHFGFDKVVWDATTEGTNTVRLSYRSPDGDQGYPGNLTTIVTYQLTDNNEITVDYKATTDKPTPVNLTQHAYFNLKGEGNGTILEHDLMIHANRYTPVDETLIPTGELAAVEGTPFDFRNAKPIGRDINLDNPQLKYGGGFDHNWVINREDDQTLVHAATLYEPTSGRVMEVLTTEPGLQFYSGNFLSGNLTGKSGKTYEWRGALCLETQHFPDSPNHENFPSTILRPGNTLSSTTVFRFSVRD